MAFKLHVSIKIHPSPTRVSQQPRVCLMHLLSGYCKNIGAGTIVVRAHVGDCPGYGNADAESGWNSSSRIIVREVPKSPYD